VTAIIGQERSEAADERHECVACCGGNEQRRCSGLTMYTPAVTHRPAWISALTGVGPSIGVREQTCNGNCALLPQAPSMSNRQIASDGAADVASLAGAAEPRLPSTPTVCTVAVSSGSRAYIVCRYRDNRACRSCPNQKQPECEAEIADAIHQKRLLAGRHGSGFDTKSDQQMLQHADRFQNT